MPILIRYVIALIIDGSAHGYIGNLVVYAYAAQIRNDVGYHSAAQAVLWHHDIDLPDRLIDI